MTRPFRMFRAAVVAASVGAAGLGAYTTDLVEFKSVPIGASGFVTGILAHPKEANLYYIRTDVGGVYRWDAAQNRWVFLLGQFGWKESINFWQVESIAIDPSDPNKVYAFVGEKNVTGDVIKSVDRGQTWTRCNFNKYAAGNADWRWAGERMAVDPFNGNIIYVGTRKDGLWRSEDGGNTWAKVTAVPNGDTDGDGKGISFVVFDTNDGKVSGKCKVIYVGVMQNGNTVYRSTDGGANWSAVGGGPGGFYPIRAAIAKGRLFVTYADTGWPYDDTSGRLYRCDSSSASLQERTPPGGLALSGVSVDPNNPDRVFVTAYPANGRWGNIFFRSTDGGNTWTAFGQSDTYLDERPWQENVVRPAWAASCLIDPHNPSRGFVTDGFQVWVCNDIWAGSRTWNTRVAGIEELVTFGALSVPGKGWFTFVGDKSGFRHSNGLENHPRAGDWWNIGGEGRYMSPRDFNDVGMTVTMDFCENNPNVLVRSGAVPFGSGGWRNGSDPYAKKSTDGGVNWNTMNKPQRGSGTVAISATDPNRMVWVPLPDSNNEGNGGVWYSTDGGNNWNTASGGPANCHWDVWSTRKALASDRVNGNTFYILGEVNQWTYQLTAKFWRSTDGGQSWTMTRDFSSGPPYVNFPKHKYINVKAAPGMAGEVWVGLGDKGLWKSSDAGSTFVQVPNVQECRSFGFGKNKPGRANPAVFVVGRVENTDGIFRSDDMGTNWVLVVPYPSPTSPTGILNDVDIIGDREVYGRFVLGTDGRGFYYGALPQGTMSITAKSASPSTVTNNTARLVVFRVSTRSSNCTVTNVSLNLSSLGGPAAAKMTNLAGGTQWRYGHTVPAGTAAGTYNIAVSAKADTGRSDATTVSVQVVTPPNRIGFRYLSAAPAVVSNTRPTVVVFRVNAASTNGTVTNVTLNLSSLSGPAAVKMSNITASTLWRYAYTVPAGLTTGWKTVGALAIDDNRNRRTNATLQVQVVNVPPRIAYRSLSSSRTSVTNFQATPVTFHVRVMSSNTWISNVKLDLTALSGPAAAWMTNLSGRTEWRYTHTVPAGLAGGTKTVPVEAVDRYLNPAYTNLRISVVVATNLIQFVAAGADPFTLTNNIARVVVVWAQVRTPMTQITNVVVNLSAVGGPSSVKMTNISGATLWRYAYTVPAGLTTGLKLMRMRAYDRFGFTNTSTAAVQVVALPPLPPVPPPAVSLDSLRRSPKGLVLQWTASTVTNFQRYEIQRSVAGGAFEHLAFLSPASTTVYTDAPLTPNKRYAYKVRVQNTAGQWSGFSEVREAVHVTVTEEEPVRVSRNVIRRRDAAPVEFVVRKPADEEVEAWVYTADGMRVVALKVPQGSGVMSVEWDGKDGNGEFVPNGMYHVCIRIGRERIWKKVAVLR